MFGVAPRPHFAVNSAEQYEEDRRRDHQGDEQRNQGGAPNVAGRRLPLGQQPRFDGVHALGDDANLTGTAAKTPLAKHRSCGGQAISLVGGEGARHLLQATFYHLV